MAGRLVLIVEDDQDTREILSELLSMEGYEVFSAADGDEALALLSRDLHPAVVVLDMVLPGTDGWAVLKAMKGDPALASIPVVAMSAAVGRVPSDADVFVRKPFALAELIGSLERARAAPHG